MLEFTKGDIFDIAVDIRVNTVNCVGAMGAGVALAFKQRYPAMFKDYQAACKAGLVRPGKMHIWKPLDGDWIINFPTKRDWRESSRYEDIDAGLDDLKNYLISVGSVSVALPALGCGNGGLDWARVSEMIRNKLSDVSAHIFVFEPSASKRAGQSIVVNTDVEIREAEKVGFEFLDVNFFGEDSSAKFAFVAGSANMISKRWIALLPSRDPGDREINALQAISKELSSKKNDFGVALIYSTKISEDVADIFSSNGISVTILLPFGVLTRKALVKRLATENKSFISAVSPFSVNEKWSKQVFAECMEIMRRNSSAVLISDPNPEWLSSKELKKWNPKPASYIKYDAAWSVAKQALAEAGVKPIGRKSDGGAPNIDFFVSAFDFKGETSVQPSFINASAVDAELDLIFQKNNSSLSRQLSISMTGMSRNSRRALLDVVLNSQIDNLQISLSGDVTDEDLRRLIKAGFLL